MDNREEKYDEAKLRANAIKAFYIHVIIFVCINAFLIVLNLIVSRSQIWFYWSLLGWGVGLLAHALGVFAFGGVFIKDWEQRKAKQILEVKESKEAEKIAKQEKPEEEAEKTDKE